MRAGDHNGDERAATIGLREIVALLKSPRVLGLAEFMNFPGVIIAGDPACKGEAGRGARSREADRRSRAGPARKRRFAGLRQRGHYVGP